MKIIATHPNKDAPPYVHVHCYCGKEFTTFKTVYAAVCPHCNDFVPMNMLLAEISRDPRKG